MLKSDFFKNKTRYGGTEKGRAREKDHLDFYLLGGEKVALQRSTRKSSG